MTKAGYRLQELESELGLSSCASSDALLERAKRACYLLHVPKEAHSAALFKLLDLCELQVKHARVRAIAQVERIHGAASNVTTWKLFEQLQETERQLNLNSTDEQSFLHRLDIIDDEFTSSCDKKPACVSIIKTEQLALPAPNTDQDKQLALAVPKRLRETKTTQLALPESKKLKKKELMQLCSAAAVWVSVNPLLKDYLTELSKSNRYWQCDIPTLESAQVALLQKFCAFAEAKDQDTEWIKLNDAVTSYTNKPYLNIYLKKGQQTARFMFSNAVNRILQLKYMTFNAKRFGMLVWQEKHEALRCRVILMIHMLPRLEYKHTDWQVELPRILETIRRQYMDTKAHAQKKQIVGV